MTGRKPMNRGPQNQRQYDILKIFTGMLLVTPQKIARVFKLPLNVVSMVAASYSYENYKLARKAKYQNLKQQMDERKEQRTQDFMDEFGDLFGGIL